MPLSRASAAELATGLHTFLQQAGSVRRAPGVLRPPEDAERRAALGSARRSRAHRSAHGVRADALALRRGAAVHHGGRRDHHGRRSRAPRPDPRKPRLQRRLARDAEPLRRPAAHPAGRDRAQPPARDVGAALRARRRRRLHRGRRRARDDEAGRFHPDAVVDVPRSRQPRQRARRLARRPGHSRSPTSSTRASPSATPTSRSRSRASKATRWPATDPACCRSNTSRRGRRRRWWPTRTRAAATRST